MKSQKTTVEKAEAIAHNVAEHAKDGASVVSEKAQSAAQFASRKLTAGYHHFFPQKKAPLADQNTAKSYGTVKPGN